MRRSRTKFVSLVTLVLLAASCVSAQRTPQAPSRLRIVVIGKSMNPYWSSVEKGVQAAGRDLGIDTALFVPPKEDVAAQIQILETSVAKRATGIAIAPSNPEAMEQVMRRAADAGVIVTTLDTPPVPGSVSRAYVGTDNYAAGEIAGRTMAGLLPAGGKVGLVRGSDTALNALQRTQGFLDAVSGTAIHTLPPRNDHEDAAVALEMATSIISANPDLAGVFGMYAYNGPAWANAIKETKLTGKIKVVCFDATSDSINGIKQGMIDAVIGQREYDMGYESVQVIALIAQKGTTSALTQMHAVNGIIRTGVDVITAATLQNYEARLDARHIPHDWNTIGWTPATAQQ